jgi:hypothetical protein
VTSQAAISPAFGELCSIFIIFESISDEKGLFFKGLRSFSRFKSDLNPIQ